MAVEPAVVHGGAGQDTAAAIDIARSVLSDASTVVVTGHINPDGDALGSLFAVTTALQRLGIEALPTWGARHEGEPPAPLEPALHFLPCAAEVVAPEHLPANIDVVVSCDTAAPSRLGTAEPILDSAAAVVVIDHHDVGEDFGDIRIVDPAASCTGVLALRLIDALGVPLDKPLADAIYLALLTDTGRFSFAATTPADHRVAARLLEAGADHVGINRAVYESASPGYLELVSMVTTRAVVDDDLVVSWVTQDDLAHTGAGEHEPDGLIDLLRKVESVDVTCFLRQTASGTWRTSLRSRGSYDVAEIARAFGGGGHRRAAGFTGTGKVTDIIAAVRDKVSGAGSAR